MQDVEPNLEQKKAALRWISRHDDPECKMGKIQYFYDEETKGIFAVCNCQLVLDVSNYG